MRSILILLAACTVCSGAVLARPFVEVSDAVVRMPKAGFSSTVIAMKVRADRDSRIVGASADFARSVELRTIQRRGVEVSQERVAEIALPRGQEIVLRTGAGVSFLMGNGIKRELKPGEHVHVMLRVQGMNGPRVESVRVRAQVVAPSSYSSVPEDHVH